MLRQKSEQSKQHRKPEATPSQSTGKLPVLLSLRAWDQSPSWGSV